MTVLGRISPVHQPVAGGDRSGTVYTTQFMATGKHKDFVKIQVAAFSAR